MEKDEGLTWRWTIFSPNSAGLRFCLAMNPERLRSCARLKGELQSFPERAPGSSTANPKSTSTRTFVIEHHY
jgi:hypothetical protein